MSAVFRIGYTSSPVTAVELGNKIYLGQQVFDFNNLTALTKFNTHTIVSSDRISGVGLTTIGPYTSQYAQYDVNVTRIPLCSFMLNPNNLPDVGQVIEVEPGKYLVSGFNNSTAIGIVDTDTDTVAGSLTYDTSRAHHAVMCRINDTDVIFNVMNRYYDRSYNMYKASYDQVSKLLSSIHTYRYYVNYSVSGFIDKTDTAIYGYTGAYVNNFRIVKYDITTESITTLYNINEGLDVITMPSNYIPNTNKLFIVRILSATELKISELTLDKTTDTVTENAYTVNNFANIINWAKSSLTGIIPIVDVDEVNNKVYLHVVRTGRSDVTLSTDNFKLLTFELDTVNRTATYIGELYLNSKIYSFVIDRDKNYFLVTDNGLYKANFINGSWIYDIVNNRKPGAVFLDSLDRLWYADNDRNVYVYSTTIPSVIDAKFTNTDIIYNGTPVSNSILLSVYNYKGERLAVDVTIKVLTGNATFDASNDVSITVTTKTDGDLEVPFTINNYGKLDVVFNIE